MPGIISVVTGRTTTQYEYYLPSQLPPAQRGLICLIEVIAFVVYQDKCREILYFDLPDSFHT